MQKVVENERKLHTTTEVEMEQETAYMQNCKVIETLKKTTSRERHEDYNWIF